MRPVQASRSRSTRTRSQSSLSCRRKHSRVDYGSATCCAACLEGPWRWYVFSAVMCCLQPLTNPGPVYPVLPGPDASHGDVRVGRSTRGRVDRDPRHACKIPRGRGACRRRLDTAVSIVQYFSMDTCSMTPILDAEDQQDFRRTSSMPKSRTPHATTTNPPALHTPRRSASPCRCEHSV